jgi:hypothetical protein
VRERAWINPYASVAPAALAKRELGLTDADLACLTAVLRPSRHSKYAAPVRLYDVRALEAVAARKASGRHTLLNATQLKRAAHQLGERIAGSRPKLIRRLRELLLTAAA